MKHVGGLWDEKALQERVEALIDTDKAWDGFPTGSDSHRVPTPKWLNHRIGSLFQLIVHNPIAQPSRISHFEDVCRVVEVRQLREETVLANQQQRRTRRNQGPRWDV